MAPPPPSPSSSNFLETVFNHVALPPRLPDQHEKSIDQIERALADRMLDAVKIVRNFTDGHFSSHWEHTRRILQVCKTVNTGGRLNKTSLLTELRDLQHRDILILHIAEQNAGLLVRRERV